MNPPAGVRLLLLRHAHVDGHRGDVPITERGVAQARRAGAWLAEQGVDVAAVMYGGTRRSRETAEHLLAGLREADGDVAPGIEAVDAFALRNPDVYLGGDRVSMVSSAEAFAEQTRALTAEQVLEVEFCRAWLEHPERVGFWVSHPAPPGDDAAAVDRRIRAFASSLADVPAWHGRTVVAVTHSPVLRSVGLALRGTDPGEPAHVTGYVFDAGAGPEGLSVDDVAPVTG